MFVVFPFPSVFRIVADNATYNAVLNGEIALPCNITAPSFDDGVSLILWYRDDIPSPIYTVDARTTSSLDTAQHFLHRDIFDKRATFNLTYPLSFLRIKPVRSSDSGDYRCRVDFRRARTVNRLLKLTVIGECAARLLLIDSEWCDAATAMNFVRLVHFIHPH